MEPRQSMLGRMQLAQCGASESQACLNSSEIQTRPGHMKCLVGFCADSKWFG